MGTPPARSRFRLPPGFIELTPAAPGSLPAVRAGWRLFEKREEMQATTAPILDVTDASGRRTVSVDRTPFTVGRRATNDLALIGGEISREHAEIVADGDTYVLRDRRSRYGTFVNDQQITEQVLASGDRIRLGGTSGGAELVFRADGVTAGGDQPATTAIGDLRYVATLLEGLRALGSGRVLDDVLALVMDSALEVTGAERGFTMLATPEGDLEFKLARARGRITLPGKRFDTSTKIPEEVFRTSEPRIVVDLLDAPSALDHSRTVQMGIRHVLCVPLKLVRYVDRRDAVSDERPIGVLYLDSREKGALLSASTRTALETLATEAAIAIENARLYREAMEKARLDQEMRIAAEIQQALLPRTRHAGTFVSMAASTLPCRAIGGDFYDCIDMPGDRFGFVLGDVSGKGPPAALMSAVVQGMFAAQTDSVEGPARTVARVNEALIRRELEGRFVTMVYGELQSNGRLTYCNSGHNAPFVVRAGGALERLDPGGPPVGLFGGLDYPEVTISLKAGDSVLIFSDGVSEATNEAGDEFGEDRIAEILRIEPGAEPSAVLAVLTEGLEAFTAGAPQQDDVTALVLRYNPAAG